MTVSVNNSTDELTIRGQSAGTATVTVRESGYKPAPVSFTVTVNQPPPAPVIRSFEADSTTITEGDCADLSWETENAESTSINQGIGTVTPTESGSKEVCPDSTTKYTLTATGEEGAIPPEVSASVTVMVMPPSCDLSSISDQTLFEDEERMLPLSSVCDGTYSASSSPSGIVTVSVNNSTDELTIRGQSAGTATVTVRVTKSGYKPDSVSFRVTVNPPPPAPEASLTADPTTIFPGERTTLSWTTTNAESGSINTEAIASTELDSGSKQVHLDSLGGYSYTLSVLRAGAKPSTAVNGAYVTVVPRPDSPMIDSFGASPATITAGGCTTLSWTTTDAVSVSISPAIGGEPLSVDGNGRVCPSSDETYKLTATGETGAKPLTATASVTVTVNPPAPSSPSITSISPPLQRPDDPVTIYGNHFGSTAGSVSFGGHSISIFSGQGYSWSNTSISLLIPGSLSAGQVSVTVTTHGGSTSDSYSYTVTGSPVSRGDCEEGDEDCPEGKQDKESGDSDEGETDEDSAEGGG